MQSNYEGKNMQRLVETRIEIDEKNLEENDYTVMTSEKDLKTIIVTI